MALQEERKKIYKEMLMRKAQIAQFKEANSDLEKEKADLLAFKAFASPKNQDCSPKRLCQS